MGVIASEGQLVSLQRPWYTTQAYGSLNLYGQFNVDYATIYRTQPNVRRVVDFLAKNIAQLGLKVYRRHSDTEREQIGDHPLAKLLRKPNPYFTRYRFIRGLVSDLAIYDNAYIIKVKAPDGGMVLQPLPPYLITVVGTNWLRPDAYRMTGTAGVANFEIQPDQLIHIRGYSPDDMRRGVPPLETLRRTLAEEAASGEWREGFWRNNARIEGVLQHPNKLSPEAADRLRTDWQALYTGPGNGGKTAILEEGMDWKPIAFSAKDSEYIASKKLALEEVAGVYQVSSPMIGLIDEANFASLTQFHRMLYQDTFGPWLTWIQEDFELQLMPEFDDIDNVYIEFNIAEKLKGSFEEASKFAQMAVGGPWVTRNEQRANQNLPPLPGGDELITPLNVSQGSPGQGPLPSAPPEAPPDLTPPQLPPKAHAAIVRTHLDRQEACLKGMAAYMPDAPAALLFDAKRWNKELTSDLLRLGGGTTDERMAKAQEAAEAINEVVYRELDKALAEGLGVADAMQAAGLAIFQEEPANAA